MKYVAYLGKLYSFSHGRNCTMLSGNRETISVRKRGKAQP